MLKNKGYLQIIFDKSFT